MTIFVGEYYWLVLWLIAHHEEVLQKIVHEEERRQAAKLKTSYG